MTDTMPRDTRQVAARVVDVLPNALYRIRMPGGDELLGHLSGGLRVGAVRLLPGDEVRVEPSPLDGGKARIVGRRSR